jgi:ATP-dependent helicase/nuclease subunit B
LFTLEKFSPTAIETMMGCRFKFFCRYGLGLNLPVLENEEEPIASERGNIIHYCLDRVLREMPLNTLSNDNHLDGFVENCIKEYRCLKLPAGYAQTKRQNYILMSFKSGIVRMVRHILGDFSNSRFKPAEFEKNVDFILPDTVTRLTGKIDRTDRHITDSSGTEYVRVTDYKSGNKELDFPSIFYGLDMQMLLYLFAVTNEKDNIKPASALYLPSDGAKTDGVLLPGANEQEMRKNWLLRHIPSGVAVNDDELYEQETRYRLESNATSRKTFMKVKQLSDTSYEKLQNYCGKLIDTQVKRVKNGNIAAIPVSYDVKNCKVCEYCEYKAACRKDKHKLIRKDLIERII